MGFEQYKDVWVFIECFEGTPKNVGLELLGQGRKLAEGLGQIQHMVGDAQLTGGQGGLLPAAFAAGKEHHGDTGQVVALLLQEPYGGGAVHSAAHGHSGPWMHGNILLGRKFNQKYIILYALGQLNAKRSPAVSRGEDMWGPIQRVLHILYNFVKMKKFRHNI